MNDMALYSAPGGDGIEAEATAALAAECLVFTPPPAPATTLWGATK